MLGNSTRKHSTQESLKLLSHEMTLNFLGIYLRSQHRKYVGLTQEVPK